MNSFQPADVFSLLGLGGDKHYVHHPKFVFDDEILPIVAELLATTAIRFLSERE